jgi:hypothetical protein
VPVQGCTLPSLFPINFSISSSFIAFSTSISFLPPSLLSFFFLSFTLSFPFLSLFLFLSLSFFTYSF